MNYLMCLRTASLSLQIHFRSLGWICFSMGRLLGWYQSGLQLAECTWPNNQAKWFSVLVRPCDLDCTNPSFLQVELEDSSSHSPGWSHVGLCQRDTMLLSSHDHRARDLEGSQSSNQGPRLLIGVLPLPRGVDFLR